MTLTEYDNPDKKWAEFTLAEKCFISSYVEDELFETVNKIPEAARL